MNNRIGRNVRILKHSVVYNSEIGNNVLIGNQCMVSSCKIGDNVIVGNLCLLCKGVTVEDNVFVGDGVIFTNDKKPSMEKYFEQCTTEEKYAALPTLVKEGATIGSGCTILPVTIGRNALIGAGSVVTHNVPDGEVWVGNPAKRLKK